MAKAGSAKGKARPAAAAPVRFEGKVGRGYRVLWAAADVWLVALAALCVYCAATMSGSTAGYVATTAVAVAAVLAFANVVFAFPLMRSYVEFDGEGNICAAYGPIVDRAPVETVVVVEKLHGAKGFLTATEVDKVHIVARRMVVYIALADEAAFFDEAARRCPNAEIVRTPKRG